MCNKFFGLILIFACGIFCGEVYCATKSNKYQKVTDKYLIDQLNAGDKKIERLRPIVNSIPAEFMILDDVLYKYLDLFVVDQELNNIKESLINILEEIIIGWNDINKKYISQALREELVSSGKSIENVSENSIRLRKEVLENFNSSASALLTNKKGAVWEIKRKLENLKTKAAQNSSVRYAESLAVLRSFSDLIEKFINKLIQSQELLTSSSEKRDF